MGARYLRWDGSQDPLGPDLDTGRMLDEISDDVLSGRGAQEAVRRLMRRGLGPGSRGLEDLRRQVRERRRRLIRRLNLAGPLAGLRERLDQILAEERRALAGQEGQEARMREAFLDSLPAQPPGASSSISSIKELMDYRFTSPQAQHMFDALVEEVQREILAAYFQSIAGGMRSLTPDQAARLKEMLKDLNQMIAARERGVPEDFRAFMDAYGDLFPERPSTLDELLEALAGRMAAMSRLLASLSEDQRRELEELTRAVMQDIDLAFEMDQLQEELRMLMPHLPWHEPAPGLGGEPMGLPAAVEAIERLSELDELDQALRGDYPGASIDDIDEDKLRGALGEEAVADLTRLKQIEKALEEAGILSRTHGRLDLTPRGVRRLGERALVKVFEELRMERPGWHQTWRGGGTAELTGGTRPWRFGDPGEISVQRTIYNAVVRRGNSRLGGPAGQRPIAEARKVSAIRLSPEDFELIEAETRTRTATVLALDLSFSMPLRGHWVPAKRMALALYALIDGKYPHDRLYLIGFSDYARRLDPTDLTATGTLERVYGTNMQHAFVLAGRLLGQHPRASKQLIMVTDGEPTAHLVDAGAGLGPEVFFSWPPARETIRKTLTEAVRLASAGITLSIFMLEDAPGLVQFMSRLAHLTGGRIFQATGAELERFVLRDYVHRRRS